MAGQELVKLNNDVRSGRTEEVTKWLDKQPDLVNQNHGGVTPLMVACQLATGNGVSRDDRIVAKQRC